MLKSNLELLVEYDMYEQGYDPTSIDDIKEYWKGLLNDN